MVPGFNTDFKYRGETYHVQTEDNGVNNPVVVTLLYFKGAILASRRTPYRDLLDKPAYQKELVELMKSQHKALMRELLAGAYDAPSAAPAPPAPPVTAAQTPAPRPAPQSAPPAVAPVSAPRVAAAPVAAPPVAVKPTTPRVILTLDQEIMRYLAEYAAGIARGAATVRP